MPNRLLDGNILRDFSVMLQGTGQIGTCPSFQPPELNVQVEEFRGGGMDAVVEVPMGYEKLECEFDLHVWDQLVFQELGFGPARQNRILIFRGYLLSPQGTERSVVIQVEGFVRNIKSGKIEPGKKSEHTISFSAHYYAMTLEGAPLVEIDIYNKIVRYGQAGDVQAGARARIAFTQ